MDSIWRTVEITIILSCTVEVRSGTKRSIMYLKMEVDTGAERGTDSTCSTIMSSVLSFWQFEISFYINLMFDYSVGQKWAWIPEIFEYLASRDGPCRRGRELLRLLWGAGAVQADMSKDVGFTMGSVDRVSG